MRKISMKFNEMLNNKKKNKKLEEQINLKLLHPNMLPIDYSYRANIYALILSILHKRNPDRAMYQMGLLEKTPNKILTDDDIKDMLKMREKGLTLRKIGDIYK